MRRSGNIMKRYEIEFRKQIKLDIDQIKDFIVKKTSRENAERFSGQYQGCRMEHFQKIQ